MMNEFKGVIFNKLAAAGTPLYVSGIRYAKPPLDFS
jgi:hypothetical protein